jgi:WD40 repeat protein
VTSFENLSNGFLASGSLRVIQIWNIEEGIILRTLKSLTGSYIYALALLQNGNLASGSGNGIIEIWNIDDGLLVESIKASDQISFLLVTKDANLVVGIEHGIKIWNPYSKEIITKMSHIKIDSIFELKNGLFVLQVNYYRISIWDIILEQEVRVLEDQLFNLKNIVVMQNGFLAIALEYDIKIWNPYEGT